MKRLRSTCLAVLIGFLMMLLCVVTSSYLFIYLFIYLLYTLTLVWSPLLL